MFQLWRFYHSRKELFPGLFVQILLQKEQVYNRKTMKLIEYRIIFFISSPALSQLSTIMIKPSSSISSFSIIYLGLVVISISMYSILLFFIALGFIKWYYYSSIAFLSCISFSIHSYIVSTIGSLFWQIRASLGTWSIFHTSFFMDIATLWHLVCYTLFSSLFLLINALCIPLPAVTSCSSDY